MPSTDIGPKLTNMKRRGYLASFAIALGLWGAACGSGDGSDSGFATMGTPGMPSPARTGANLIFAEVGVDGNAGPCMLVDTGSPFTLIDPTDFPAINFPDSAEVKVDLTFGTFTVKQVPALQTQFITGGAYALPPIVGGNLTREFSTQLDYRGMQLRIGDGSRPRAASRPGARSPSSCRGGGAGTINAQRTMTVHYPATRISLTVDIDGTSHPVILDSGASEVTVRQELFDELTADGRAQQAGFALSTASGPMTGRVTRARSITVGDETGRESRHPVARRRCPVRLSRPRDRPPGRRPAGRHLPARVPGHHRLPRPVPCGCSATSPLRRCRTSSSASAIEIHRRRAARFTVSKVYAGSDAAATSSRSATSSCRSTGRRWRDGYHRRRPPARRHGRHRPSRSGSARPAPRQSRTATVTVRVDDLLPAP